MPSDNDGTVRVLFINPPWTLKGGVWRDVAACMPSLGLGYVASYLRKNSPIPVQIRIIDMIAERISPDGLPAILRGEEYDFVGITSTTVTIRAAIRCAKAARALFPHARIVFGGVHPSILPDEVLSHDFVDFVIRNEGEIPMLELVSGRPAQEIRNLSYKKDGKVIHNPAQELIKNLDDLPFPAYDLMPIRKYYPAVGSYKRLPALSVIATRGCPGQCTFCYKVFGRTLRSRSAKNIFDEVAFLHREYGIREIAFYDDTFTSFRDNVKEFCSLLMRSGLKITWSCFSRVDCIDRETLALMKRAGCHQILYGVESADKAILQNIRKGIDLERVRAAVRMTKEAGISPRCSFMLGNPGETRETIERTIQFALELDPDLAMFNITVPFPGTKMFEWAKQNGLLLTENWDDYDLSKQVMRLPTISDQDLRESYSSAYRRFFLRPKYMLRRLAGIRSVEDAVELANGAKAVANVVKSRFVPSKKPLGSAI
ncbi:B12-binding domain-containing radical SAM protein [Candidatus Micrarchaeota archaeon]|nr:B12-binding domain-containing radical SAM protein [Candidatus Micrarchaeota archaeon]